MKSLVYLQIGFWKQLKADRSREGISIQLGISNALLNSLVITNATEEDILNDDFLKEIIIKGNYERCDEKYIDKRIDALKGATNIDDLCATFLLDKDSISCDSLELRYGVVAINATLLRKRKYLLLGDGVSFEKNKRYLQRFISFGEQLNHPCNSIIIIDPYLLLKRKISNNQTVVYPDIDGNLIPLLQTILPERLDIILHITIVSCIEKNEEAKRIYEKIKKSIRQARPTLHTHLGLINIDKGYNHEVESFHSRHILTNNYSIDSEDGFNLFDNNGYLTKNNPSISIVYPRIYGDYRKDLTKYFSWIGSVKKYSMEFPNSICGEKHNRLFELES